jgi:hypothetical protein
MIPAELRRGIRVRVVPSALSRLVTFPESVCAAMSDPAKVSQPNYLKLLDLNVI